MLGNKSFVCGQIYVALLGVWKCMDLHKIYLKKYVVSILKNSHQAFLWRYHGKSGTKIKGK